MVVGWVGTVRWVAEVGACVCLGRVLEAAALCLLVAVV